MESGEEQHFLRGKPAFRAQTLFQAPQTGNALSPIYVFHPVPRKHECRKTGMRVHVHGRVSDNTHTQNKRQAGRLITDKWAKTSQDAAIAQRSQCIPAVIDHSQEEAAPRRWHGEGQTSSKIHSTDLLLLLSQVFLSSLSAAVTEEFKKKAGRRLSPTLPLTVSLPAGRPPLILNYIQIRLLMKSVWF